MSAAMLAEKWLARARQSLVTVDVLLGIPDFDRACSTAYYAMFYAARAALFHVGEAERAFGKTHSGMISGFNLHLVKSGLIDPAFGSSFQQTHNKRLVADYEADGVSEETSRAVMASATTFVAAVAALIEA